MEKLNYQAPKAGRIMKFFWRAAGGDEFILSRSTYSDQVKYFCLGGIVIATAFMAALSSGYAVYTIFAPKGFAAEREEILASGLTQYVEVFDVQTIIMSIVFGAIWGLIIFNLDRFIVASTGQGDGTEAITWDELKSAVPRILMGIIIAVTISKPVEIRILQSEIDHYLDIKQNDEKAIIMASGLANLKSSKLEVDKEMKLLLDDNSNLSKQWTSINTEYVNEVTGKNNNGAGEGARAKVLKIQMNSLQNRMNSNKSEVEGLRAELDKLEVERKALDGEADMQVSGFDGLAERIEIAHEHYFGVTIFITLLFLAIELTPIFFKLMLIKSPYDYLSDNYKAIEIAKQGIYIEQEYYEDKEGKQRELVRSLAAEKETSQQKELFEAQMRIMKYAIEKFEANEKQKVDANPEEYINYEDPKS